MLSGHKGLITCERRSDQSTEPSEEEHVAEDGNQHFLAEHDRWSQRDEHVLLAGEEAEQTAHNHVDGARRGQEKKPD